MTEYEKTDTQVLEDFQEMGSWKRFNPTEYRNSNHKTLKKAALLIPITALTAFWDAPTLLQARNIWYRTLSKKLPITKFLHKFKTVYSSMLCRLCKGADNDFDCFIINCEKKNKKYGR